MIKIFCDRCGDEIETGDEIELTVTTTIKKDDHKSSEKGYLTTLCQKCITEFNRDELIICNASIDMVNCFVKGDEEIPEDRR